MLEQFKVSIAANACGAQIVLDDEDRDVLVFWYYYWSQNAGLGENQVVAGRLLCGRG
jgi:hypothetical protein